MDAYIDLSFIFHVLTLLNVPYYFKKIGNIKIKIIELISIIFFSIVLYFNVFVIENYKYINLLFLLIYFLLVYRKNFLKYYILYLFTYYGSLSSSMIFTNEVYLYNGLVFLNSIMGMNYILMQIMNIIIIELIMFSIRSIKLLKNYKTKIEIKIDDKYLKMDGYIDSGNTLLIEGKPVIFLKESYFKNNEYKEMIVRGIGSSKCKYFTTKVRLNYQEKEVICASGNNKGYKGCDCLINIHLIGGEENEINE